MGKDRPTGIDFLEEASASPTEKIPEPWPRPDTGGRRPWELGRLRAVLWHRGQRGDFFNLSLKFAPTGSRTQDLRSAAGFL